MTTGARGATRYLLSPHGTSVMSLWNWEYEDFTYKTKLTSFCWKLLPSELIRRVVDILASDCSSLKFGLTSPALVCRDWAQIIRPSLFQSLLLRDAGDIGELLKILSTPPVLDLDISRHIRNITYAKFDHCVPPWLRLGAISKRVPTAKFYFLISNSQRYSSELDGNSILRCLPRTLPPSVFPHCTRLYLRHVCFKSSKDLVQLIHAFPSAREYDYEGVLVPTPLRLARGGVLGNRKQKGGSPSKVHFWLSGPTYTIPYNDFATQLDIALLTIAARERLLVPQEPWGNMEAALVGLVSSSYILREATVDKSGKYYSIFHRDFLFTTNLRRDRR